MYRLGSAVEFDWLADGSVSSFPVAVLALDCRIGSNFPVERVAGEKSTVLHLGHVLLSAIRKAAVKVRTRLNALLIADPSFQPRNSSFDRETRTFTSAVIVDYIPPRNRHSAPASCKGSTMLT